MLFYFSCLLFFAVPYGICLGALLCDGGARFIRNLYHSSSILQKMLICAVTLINTTILIFWVQQDHFIYYWDYSGYWMRSVHRMQYMTWHGVKDTVSSLIASVNADDYNLFLPTITAFPLSAFGITYPTYVVVTYIMFQIPSALIMALSAVKPQSQSSQRDSVFFTVAFVIALIFPAGYYATLRGYIDVGFLLFASSAMFLIVDYDFGRVSVSRNIFLAILFVLTWISRRYTVYLIIGFVLALIIKACYKLVRKETAFITVIINFLIIGGISLGILLLLFRDFFLHALLTDYAGMYSAYDAPLKSKIASVLSSCSFLAVIPCLVSLLLCVMRRRNQENAISWIAMLLVEAVLFWQTQAMGVQHVLILLLPFYMLCMLCFDFMEEEKHRDRKWKLQINHAAGIVCFVLLFYYFLYAFVPKLSFLPGKPVCSSRYTALQRDDISELKSMASFINRITEENNGKVYFAASGSVLNSSIMKNLELPYSDDAVPNAYTTNDVDLRDGFPNQFLTADYVVSTSPTQLHLAQGQEVVRYLSDGVQDPASPVGRHFEKIQSFELEQGVTANIYQKTSEYTENDLQGMRDYFSKLYPGQGELFSERIVSP